MKNSIGPQRQQANRDAFERMTSADPVLVDVQPAIDIVPGLKPNMILTSGPGLPWADYVGGQREGIIGGALYEGLASTREDAIAKLD